MNIDLGLSIAGPAFRFGPEFLFLSGEDGTATGNPFEAFTDTGGTTAADFGDAIARINDRSPNGRNALQSSSALRPLLGRAPVEVRNLIENSRFVGFSVASGNQASEGVDVFSPNPAVIAADVVGVGSDSVGSYIDVRFHGSNTTGSTFFASIRNLGAKTAKEGDQLFSSIDVQVLSDVGADTPTLFSTARWQPSNTLTTTPNLPVGADMARYGLLHTPAAPSGTTSANNWITSVRVLDGESVDITYRVRRWQSEIGTEETAYQATRANGLNITETGFPSPAFIRPDLSDDVLPTAFPDGFTGDVMVFGRKGSWIERGVEIASAGSLNIGPETFTGAPAGVLPALGDIVGWVAVERTLTDFEVARLVQYHRARGAKGLLVPGAELITNGGPGFADTTGWQVTFAGSGLDVDDGELVTVREAESSGPARIEYPYSFTPDGFYLCEAEIISVDLPAGSCVLAISGAAGFASALPILSTSTVGAVSGKTVLKTRDGDNRILFGTTAAMSEGEGESRIVQVSVRELRPQEDW